MRYRKYSYDITDNHSDTAEETTAGVEQPFEICFWSVQVQVRLLTQEDLSISLVITGFPYKTFKRT